MIQAFKLLGDCLPGFIANIGHKACKEEKMNLQKERDRLKRAIMELLK